MQLDLTEPTQLEFRATAFAPYPVYASATLWVLPGMQLLDDPGLVLSIAGLCATVTASVAGNTVTVTANVTMMCGCPITDASQQPPSGTEPYWPSSEFEVTAEIRPQDGRSNISVPLACTATSIFSGSVDLQRRTFDVWVVAVQAKETNVGFAKTTVTVTM